MRKSIKAFLFILMLASCSILPVEDSFKQAFSKVELGSIGVVEKSIRKTDFKEFTLPIYNTKIKLKGTIKPFNYKNYMKYSKYCKTLAKPIGFKFIDSIKERPNYISLNLLDKFEVIKTFNETETLNVLKTNPELLLISHVKVYPSKELLSFFEQSDAIYLVSGNRKEKIIEFYNNNNNIKNIVLSDLEVFGYKTSGFCWGYNLNDELELKAIREQGDVCSGDLTKRPKIKSNKSKIQF